MSDRFYGGDDFEVEDFAFLCMSYDNCPDGLLWGYEADGDIAGTYNADDDIIIGCIDAPDRMPAGAWESSDNALMYGAFAILVRRGQ